MFWAKAVLVCEADGIVVAHGANRGDAALQWIRAVEDGGITRPEGVSINDPVKYAAVFDGLGFGIGLSHIWRCGLQILHRLRRFMETD